MISKKEIRWSPRAEVEYINTIRYLKKKWTDREADRYAKRFNQRLRAIMLMPKAFPVIHYTGIRKCVINKQNILYYIEQENHIELVAFHDPRSNPADLELPSGKIDGTKNPY